MQMPSAASTLMAMTNLSPAQSAAYLKEIRDQTSDLVKQGIANVQLAPYQFQSALSKAFGSEALGVVSPMGKIDYNKLDILMGGCADIHRQANGSNYDMSQQKTSDFDIFDALFETKPKLFNISL